MDKWEALKVWLINAAETADYHMYRSTYECVLDIMDELEKAEKE